MPLKTISFASTLLASLLCAAPAFSAEQKHQLLGTWSVDVSRIQQPHPPKSVTITVAEAAEGSYQMTVVIVSPSGETTRAESVFKADGTAAPARGSLDVDIVSMTMPSDRILVMGAGIAGHPSSSRVFSLSDDGKHMVETIIRHLPDGTPYTRTNTWTRQ
jgi:hypothetical protein